MVCWVPFYDIAMPLLSNSGGSPIKIDPASENFPIFSKTSTHWRKNIKFSLTIQNISDLNYPKRTDLRLGILGNPRRDSARTLRLGTGGLRSTWLACFECWLGLFCKNLATTSQAFDAGSNG